MKIFFKYLIFLSITNYNYEKNPEKSIISFIFTKLQSFIIKLFIIPKRFFKKIKQLQT